MGRCSGCTFFCLLVLGFLHLTYAQDQIDPPSNITQCDLQQAIDIALKNNPDLMAQESELRAADARRANAALWPNPTFSAEAENFSGDKPGFSRSENTFSITQPFLTGGKIKLQRSMAESERAIAQHIYEAKKIALITAVEEAVYHILLALEAVAFSRENQRNAQKLHDYMQALPEARATRETHYEILSAALELSQAELNTVKALRDLDSAKGHLTTLWGMPELQLEEVKCKLDRTFTIPGYEPLREYVIENNSELKAAREEVSRNRIALQLAKAERIPDPDLGFGVRQFAEDDSYSFVTGISFPLPFFNQNQERIREALHAMEKKAADEKALLNKLLQELDRHHRDYEAALHEVNTTTRLILPRAQNYFEMTVRQYQETGSGYLDVLNAESKLAEIKKRYAEALCTLQTAVANLERLCARHFHGSQGEIF